MEFADNLEARRPVVLILDTSGSRSGARIVALDVNRRDRFIAVRNGAVEAVWPILAKGCHH